MLISITVFIAQHLFCSLWTSCGQGIYIPGEYLIAQHLFYSVALYYNWVVLTFDFVHIVLCAKPEAGAKAYSQARAAAEKRTVLLSRVRDSRHVATDTVATMASLPANTYPKPNTVTLPKVKGAKDTRHRTLPTQRWT